MREKILAILRELLAESSRQNEVNMPPNHRKIIYEALVKSYEDGYKEIWEIWKVLEIKAQGTIVTAGIFLSAIVAFLTKGDPECQYIHSKISLGLLVAIVITLGTSILLAALVLLVKEVDNPPQSGPWQDHLLSVLLKNDADLEGEIDGFSLSLIELWKNCMSTNDAALKRKSKLLKASQITILGSVAFVAALILVNLF